MSGHVACAYLEVAFGALVNVAAACRHIAQAQGAVERVLVGACHDVQSLAISKQVTNSVDRQIGDNALVDGGPAGLADEHAGEHMWPTTVLACVFVRRCWPLPACRPLARRVRMRWRSAFAVRLPQRASNEEPQVNARACARRCSWIRWKRAVISRGVSCPSKSHRCPQLWNSTSQRPQHYLARQ